MTDVQMPLADLIDAVREELQRAADQAGSKRLQFEVQDVELEVEVTTSGSREAEGGIKLWVVNLGAKGSRTNANTHRVTLHLTAEGRGGTRLRVRDSKSPPVRRVSKT
jgi:hypothetical protein